MKYCSCTNKWKFIKTNQRWLGFDQKLGFCHNSAWEKEMKANGNLEISPTSELDFCSNHIEVRCSIPPQGALPHHLAVTLKKHIWQRMNMSMMIKGRSPNKKTGKCGNFSQVGDPPPLPPVWEPHVCEKKLRFILHFRTLGTFLVFTKMFTFGW